MRFETAALSLESTEARATAKSAIAKLAETYQDPFVVQHFKKLPDALPWLTAPMKVAWTSS